jgi:DNA-binding PadR family transcriptional regulator
MTLTPNMKALLVAILGEVRRLEAVPDKPPPGLTRHGWRPLWHERQEYLQFGVRHDLDRWLGHAPTPSDSAVVSRALRNMEDRGLVVRISQWDGRRATHVQLTDEGRVEAERLVAEQAAAMAALLKDLAPLAESLGPQGETDPNANRQVEVVPARGAFQAGPQDHPPSGGRSPASGTPNPPVPLPRKPLRSQGQGV